MPKQFSEYVLHWKNTFCSTRIIITFTRMLLSTEINVRLMLSCFMASFLSETFHVCHLAGSYCVPTVCQGLPWWLSGKRILLSQCRRCGVHPWIGKTPGEGNGYPLQYSCLGNPVDRGVWWVATHGVANSQTLLGDETTAVRQMFCKRWRDFKYVCTLVICNSAGDKECRFISICKNVSK